MLFFPSFKWRFYVWIVCAHWEFLMQMDNIYFIYFGKFNRKTSCNICVKVISISLKFNYNKIQALNWSSEFTIHLAKLSEYEPNNCSIEISYNHAWIMRFDKNFTVDNCNWLQIHLIPRKKSMIPLHPISESCNSIDFYHIEKERLTFGWTFLWNHNFIRTDLYSWLF